MLTRRAFVKTFGVGVTAVLASKLLAAETTRRPSNVVFILADDLGWRDLGCYGHKIHETPHIDKLAADGMRFTNAYAACPVCSPTRASIMTGKYPSRTGITNWLPGDNYKDTPLPCERTAQFMKLEETTLAEALKAAGRQTAFVGKWHLGEKPYYPQHQGFDVNVAGNHWGHPHKGYFSPYNMEHLENGPKGEYLTDRLTSEAIRVMEDFSRSDKPWLMYLSYYTVHAPFHAKAERVKKYAEKARQANVKLNANYAAMVESLDENVGRIGRWLDEKGLRKDTIIIFTSDNGGFHAATHNRPLRGYKGELYEGGIRVPWIVQWPGVTKPGSVCKKPVISTDFYPTILEMTGQALRPEQHRDGVSLVPMLKGDPDFDRGAMIWHYPHYLPRHHAKPGSAIRIGDWKLIQYYEDGRQEVYNLKSDIGESDNLAKRMPAKAAEMKGKLDEMLKEHGAKIPATNHGSGRAASPNILWISLEDITPMMGCYGDRYARTPAFDGLAAEGIRYTRAHAVSPVCSPSRSSVITGMYPSSLGTMHHRSSARPPKFLKMLPSFLREAGYYTCNNSKKDYNMASAAWHVSSGKAHWRNRPDKKQPFFAVFNLGQCHSSITKIPEDKIVKARLSRLKPEDFHDPEKAPIPPYHPDVPEFRLAWARYYDAVTQVDYRAGDLIDQLKEDGLWDDTIVFVWADHGVGMPRGKHNAWEQGTHVPLIVRFPKKYQRLAPVKPGSVIDGLVTLMDLGPSALALAGLETPAWMHGRPLLCKGKGEIEYRDYVISMRDRLDTRFEMVRSVRDERYRYQRNFYPHLPFKPHEDFEFNAPVLRKWVELARQGKLTGPQAMLNLRFKPIEELYDSRNDPHMIHNLADDPKYEAVVQRMRAQLHDWMVKTRDLGILEEAEMVERARNGSPWDLGQSLANYEQILDTADLQLRGKAATAKLLARAKDPDAAVRFWAVLGLAACRSGDEPVVSGLKSALQDESVSVRITAAEGLFNLGRYEEGLPALIGALRHPVPAAQIRAAGVLDSQPPEANPTLQPAIDALKQAAGRTDVRRLPGIPYGLNAPFKRAFKAITGQESYYRWGAGALGLPSDKGDTK